MEVQQFQFFFPANLKSFNQERKCYQFLFIWTAQPMREDK